MGLAILSFNIRWNMLELLSKGGARFGAVHPVFLFWTRPVFYFFGTEY